MKFLFVRCCFLLLSLSFGYEVSGETRLMKMESKQTDRKLLRNPLLIGCSGGTGHNSAIDGIADDILPSLKETGSALVQHDARLAGARSDSPERDRINRGLGIMDASIIGTLLKKALAYTFLPVLPSALEVMNEVNNLSGKQEKKPQRTYIDMLLDVYPAGYESAAIWNVLQTTDKTAELRKLIALQKHSDADNYLAVRKYFLEKLKDAAVPKDGTPGTPFTEVISTQAMSLPALCDAVIEYNAWIKESKLELTSIHIKQYMTDLATEGAVHFFNPLSQLTRQQQAQMELHGINCDDEIMERFFPAVDGQLKGHAFINVVSIAPSANPMVRAGFKKTTFDNSKKFAKPVSLALKGRSDFEYIAPNERIASIMLGGQGGKDSYRYIKSILDTGCDKVFVFGGDTSFTREKIAEVVALNPQKYTGRIISLGNQGDAEIAALMSRSNIIVTRGGGLSVMEQMAMNHSTEQTVLIHHADSPAHILTSGISWEDANVEALIKNMKERGVHSKKTSPNCAFRHLQEAQLISASQKWDVENRQALSEHIQEMSDETLNDFFVKLSNFENNEDSSPEREVLDSFSSRQEGSQSHLRSTGARISKIKEHYIERIIEGLNLNSGNPKFLLERLEQIAQDKKRIPRSLYEDVQTYGYLVKFESIIESNMDTKSASYTMRMLRDAI